MSGNIFDLSLLNWSSNILIVAHPPTQRCDEGKKHQLGAANGSNGESGRMSQRQRKPFQRQSHNDGGQDKKGWIKAHREPSGLNLRRVAHAEGGILVSTFSF